MKKLLRQGTLQIHIPLTAFCHPVHLFGPALRVFAGAGALTAVVLIPQVCSVTLFRATLTHMCSKATDRGKHIATAAFGKPKVLAPFQEPHVDVVCFPRCRFAHIETYALGRNCIDAHQLCSKFDTRGIPSFLPPSPWIVPQPHKVPFAFASSCIHATTATDEDRDAGSRLKQGASGIVYGRNVIQHPNPRGITQALMAMVHRNVSVDEALKLI